MTPESRRCPECGAEFLYSAALNAVGDTSHLLPGLGGFLHPAELHAVVCASCGLTRFYADASAREKLARSKLWKKL